MLRFVVGAFMVLHGLAHLLYFGQSRRLFLLQPGLLWPDGSWAFASLLGNAAARSLASIACVVAALAFAAGGAGLLAGQAWWRAAIVGAAAFSSVVFLLFWDGGLQRLPDKGGVALLINTTILFAVLGTRWLDFEF